MFFRYFSSFLLDFCGFQNEFELISNPKTLRKAIGSLFGALLGAYTISDVHSSVSENLTQQRAARAARRLS